MSLTLHSCALANLSEETAVGTEQDEDEFEYDQWNIADAKTLFAREQSLLPSDYADEIWPDWSEGRPTKLRRKLGSPEFTKDGVHHRYREYYATIVYDWKSSQTLVELKKNYRLLPSTDWSHWSGVYRVFAEGTTIDRC